MSFLHLLRETCYVEDVAVDASGVDIFGDDGEYSYTGTVRKLKCSYVKRQRIFRSSGSQGEAGERVSNHELVTAEEINEAARVWYPGQDQTDVNQSLTPIGVSSMTRPYGGLSLYHTFL